MGFATKNLIRLLLLAGLLILPGVTAASAGIETSFGSDIPLSGYSTSGPFVYLFLTGPNIPENGVALHDITKRSDMGYFTRVSVDGDDRWSYTWHTASINGRLDAGTYTVWVVDTPNDRSRLAYADFGTISVTLGKPSIRVDTPALPGAMELQSVPDGAAVAVNGEDRGMTPLTLREVQPGSYTLTFSRPGFETLTTRVSVEQGRISDVRVTLVPETGTLAVNSTPSGARVLLDGTDAGLSPVILTNITAGNHSVSIQKGGYIPADQGVNVTGGKVSTVDVYLKPQQAQTASTRAAGSGIVTAAGAVLVILLCTGRRFR